MYTGLLLPTLLPFFFHWYTGVEPPFTGVAVKVTGELAHTGFREDTMLTETGRTGLTATGRVAIAEPV